ncbi:type IV pilus twitching motility protein PilT [Synechococcus sp. CBW1004]|uniref:type IV pilus twitching motility protein PilT n=1 Tax=Synechococcus sp. CBW1004 TaxID=1353136 RepID=UPI001E2A41CE|nr:type IV pilus twitching motility protein PilT [Synechococcus sp. CBW1004]
MGTTALIPGPMAELPFGPAAVVPPPPPPQGHGSPPPPPAASAAPAAATAHVGPATLKEIVAIAHDNKYSDIHIGVGEQPRFRDRGEMHRTDWSVTDTIRFRDWVREMLSPAEIDSFLREKEYDGAFDFGFVRVRINLLDTLRGPAMVLRLIPQKILTMEQLALPPVLAELAERPKGMILVTGPTGSGKSTTLAAMIDYINRTMKRHILTIEDPIEFVHQSQQSLIRQREVHQHTRLFANALRAALREDPDVILIGEIRDQETLSTAMEASQTGHLVFGTLHTNSAVRTVERILGMYKPEEQEQIRRAVSETLLAVVSQGLIRTTDGKRCGYHDLFVNTDACRDYIQRGALDEIEEIMRRSSFDGMQTSNQALAALVLAGRVEAEDALAQSAKPGELAQALRGRV